MLLKERFKVIPAVYLMLMREDKILLMRRANTGYRDGWYCVPAGHHDGGQSLTEAMAREAREEIGIIINPQDLTFVHVQHRLHCNDGERIDFFYSCASWTGEIVNKEPGKCDEIAWYSWDALPENTIPNVRGALASIRAGIFYRELAD